VIFGKGNKMKKGSFLPAIAALILIAGMAICCPAEETGGRKAAPQIKADANRPFEMPKDMIDKILADIKERDPNKAKELEALRDKDPAKFREELREIFHERMETMRDRGFGPEEMAGGPGGPEGHKGMAGPPAGPGEPPPGFRPFQEKSEEFLKWVKDNYPDEAKKLEELKSNQDLYERQLRLLGRKYGWLYERIRENPKLGEVLKEDMELAKERNSILKKIKEAKSNAEKEKLKAELEKVVSERYDLIVKRTQIEYEQLSNKLEELKKQVEESKANVKKWKDEEFKKEQVKKQVKRLLEQGDEPFPRWE
jgi:hypothetical protein